MFGGHFLFNRTRNRLGTGVSHNLSVLFLHHLGLTLQLTCSCDVIALQRQEKKQLLDEIVKFSNAFLII